MDQSKSFDFIEISNIPNAQHPFYEKCDPIFVYGAGNMGKYVCALLNSNNIKVAGFLDQKAVSGEKWNEIPVYPPDWDGLPAAKRKQAGIIVALHNPDVEIPPIINYLRERGFGRIVNLIQFFDCFSTQMEDRFWLTARSSYKAWEKDIQEGCSVWEDQLSRQLYMTLLKFRLTGDYALAPIPDTDSQYFPAKDIRWNAPLRFVDCGAYDGDTLRSLLDSRYAIESTAVFEPDPKNFNKLTQFIASNWSTEIVLWPCGIHSSTRQLNFSDDNNESSRLCESGNILVQAVALDDVIPSFKPNLIKFDIEGAEYEGLIGAKRLIQENRPGLAICLYHRPDHLWSIPLLIKSWNLGYKLYLRVYKRNGFEAVMYATTS